MRYEYTRAPRPQDLSVEDGVAREAKDLKTIARAVPCQEACPTHTDVPAYIEHIVRGEDDAAYRINQEDNVFPGVLGRICTRVCEDRCRHLWTNVEGPVQICHLKRYAADHVREKQGPLAPWADPTGKRVAVVGGGPAGLTAARELSRLGHEVTVLERSSTLGGMLVQGIPGFRLPRDVISAEVDLILQGGVRAQTDVSVDAARVSSLAQDFDAVLLAAGTMLPNALTVDGALGDAQMGLDFMARFNAGALDAVDGDVLVIGGGFTAVDCARSARRLAPDASRITLAYRRTEASMSADLHEIAAMVEEGVAVRTLLTPKAVETGEDGRRRMIFERNRVAPAPPGEKPPIEAVPGSRVAIPFDTLVVAIGQHRDASLLPAGVTLAEGHRTSHERIFTAGDFQGGAADVITAVASGKAAAVDMDAVLQGGRRLFPAVDVEKTDRDGDTGRVRDHDLQQPLPMPLEAMATRMTPEREVETGFTAAVAEVAGTRCYLCNYKFTIDPDLCIHCDWCIQVAPRDCIQRVSKVISDKDGFPTRVIESELARETTFIHIDNDECIRCGKCLRVCPVGAIDMKKLTRVTECRGC